MEYGKMITLQSVLRVKQMELNSFETIASGHLKAWRSPYAWRVEVCEIASISPCTLVLSHSFWILETSLAGGRQG